jgi:hypothetical protein
MTWRSHQSFLRCNLVKLPVRDACDLGYKSVVDVTLRTVLLSPVLLFVCAVGWCGTAAGGDGWYTSEQAAAGAKAYKKSCASCHGATLQGGMGPVLVGKPFWRAYGGKKVSTLWSNVHTQMPMMAPGSVAATNSVNIMAFLLRKNGVPAGTTPLDDTVDLSKALPSK